MIKITNSQDFEKVISNMEIRLKNMETIFQNQTNNIERINSTETWTGETQEIVYSKYKELAENYNPILESLKIYIKFLKQTIENYKQIEIQIGTNINSNSSQLDVNS